MTGVAPLVLSADCFNAQADGWRIDTETLHCLQAGQPLFWANPHWQATQEALKDQAQGVESPSLTRMQAAHDRLQRWAPVLAQLFPTLEASQGFIEAPLVAVPQMAAHLGIAADRLWVQCDHALPVAGSVKARGGFHEVLEHAEAVAQQHGLWKPDQGMKVFLSDAARALFAQHKVAVGSTGNLGMAIGMMAAALGFHATVHMSVEAKEWKKMRLRAHGVEVVEHAGDYEQAVAQGRAQVQSDPMGYFVDDERSISLFAGYSAAAIDVAKRLQVAGIQVSAATPLVVHIPCGVGGAPAGVAWGLRQVLGPHVHAVFMEPVQSPCFLMGMAAPAGRLPSVYELGLTNRTEADGLAVPRASALALGAMRNVLAACATVTDAQLLQLLAHLYDTESMAVEPSAAAGFAGPALLQGSAAGLAWAQQRHVDLAQIHHLVWTTGGSLVPPSQLRDWQAQGRRL